MRGAATLTPGMEPIDHRLERKERSLMTDGPIPRPTTKAELMNQIDQTWTELAAVVAEATDESLTTPGPDGWTGKDHLAHVTAWERTLRAILSRESRAAAVGIDDPTYTASTIDGLNALLHQQNRDRSLTDVRAAFTETHESVLAALAPLTDADLQRPYTEYQPEDPRVLDVPILDTIVANTCEHYAEHLPLIRDRVSGGS